MEAEDLRRNAVNRARERRIDNWSGIKFFDGDPLPDKLQERVAGITIDYLREQRHVWRPEETVEAAKLFFGIESTGQRLGLQVIGEPQSGKGSILFGLSEICDVLGIGYVFIDGHHQEVEGSVVAETIDNARKMRIPVFFDSTDYLFLGSRSAGRSISINKQKKRVPVIMRAIDEAKTIPIAITAHDELWAKEFLNLDLREQFAYILNSFPKYTLSPYLQSEASIRQFLLDNQIPEWVVDYLLGMKNDSFVREELAKLTPQSLIDLGCNLGGNTQFTDEDILTALKAFCVLKDLARAEKDTLLSLVETLVSPEVTLTQKQEAIYQLGVLLLKLEGRRRNLIEIRRKKLPRS